MEKKRRSSSAGPPREEAMSRSCSRRSLRMSTRGKKVAPPPPPPLSNGRPPLSSTPGEDSAFDEALDGHMEIQVVLPDLKKVHMTVDRRTPMMDLLVHATTSNKISPGGHIINVISKDERNILYKPNTPIGSLDAHTVYIIPKSTLELPVKRMPKLANQPFEQTFRLQVNLPQNQRMVLRVSPRITLAELKQQICSDKELDHSSHHLVHPAQPDTILDLNATLEVYGCAEISLMSNSGLRDSIQRTSTNIYPIPRIEEEKKKPGIFRIFTRKKKGDFSVENTNGSNGGIIPTSHSENSSLNKRNSYQPKQSLKRKPAPPPPAALLGSSPPLITQSSNSLNSRPESEISVKTADEIEGSISHSRHSSDSSGYHEPSVFSDCSEQNNKSPEASIVHGGGDEVKRASMGDLRHAPSCSNVSIVSASRKRKAPLPPVSTLPAIESPSTPDPPPGLHQRESKSLEDVPQQPHQESKAQQLQVQQESKALQQESKVQEHQESVVQQHQVSKAQQQPDSLVQQHQVSKAQQESVVQQHQVSKAQQQQESEALQYLEDVLQESENSTRNFSGQRGVLDDSDTDSLRDEGEVISVCQAEVHANDQDSSDSVVEPPTVVTPDPSVALPKSSCFAPLSAPNSQPDRHEVVDPSADDSGISQTLTSDADSSLPSLNSDLKAMSDSGCHEEIYCNVSDSLDTKSVPSSDEFHVYEDIVENIAGEQAQETSNSSSAQNGLEEEDFKVDQAVSTEESSEKSISLEEIHTVPKTLESIMDVPTTVAEVPTLQPSPLKPGTEEIPESKYENNSDKVSITSSSVSLDSPRSSTTHTPQLQKKLDNFALGCYRKDSDIDIYSVPSPEDRPSNNLNGGNRKEIQPPVRRKKVQPDVKISSFKERSLKDSGESMESTRGNVSEKCAQLSNTSTLPLTGRSTSLFNLVPQKKLQRAKTEAIEDEELVNGNMKRTHSDQNIAKDLEAVEMKDTFLQEQKRLQEEYRRLQEQFISWQKQLLSNQNLLQNEKIVPQMPFPSLEGLTSLDSNTHAKLSYENNSKQKSDTNINYNDYKTRSLPRPKTKPLSVKEPGRPNTPPLSQAASDTAVVDIDINAKVPARRPESITSCSVDTQVSFNQDKIVQVPPPQDKDTQVPSPQEKVTSGTQVPSPETILNKDTSAQTSEVIQTSSSDNSLSSPESENSKSQTLPRPKPKPISALPPSQTMTLNRNSRPKSQVVSVTIGSWHQRQPADLDIEKSSSVASTRSKFLSMENIPQESAKPVYSTIEKRKLPPVPTETVPKTAAKSTEPKTASATMAKSIVMSSTRPKGHEESKPDVDKKVASKVPVVNEARGTKTVPKQVEDTNVKQKAEIKLASREPTATFKLAKPFVKLSSMKDEPHTPSIIGLRKWPLSEISETDGKQSMLDDLRASSKRPGGYVHDKIRRAEVDLRKPKSSKQEPNTVPKTVDDSNEASNVHITKVTVTRKPSATDSHAPPKHSSSTSNAQASVSRSQTLPKSMSLNSELLSVFSKKASASEKHKEEPAVKQKTGAHQTVTVVNGSSAPPPPPPMPQASTSGSAMPTIPPAEQIPVSSQLLMARETKTLPTPRKDTKKKSPTKFSRTSDPREELMLEIRGFGGKQALRKLVEKTCLTLLKKSPKKKSAEGSSKSAHQ